MHYDINVFLENMLISLREKLCKLIAHVTIIIIIDAQPIVHSEVRYLRVI